MKTQPQERQQEFNTFDRYVCTKHSVSQTFPLVAEHRKMANAPRTIHPEQQQSRVRIVCASEVHEVNASNKAPIWCAFSSHDTAVA